MNARNERARYRGPGAGSAFWAGNSGDDYTTSSQTLDKFRSAMWDTGLACHGEIVPDGKLHRLHVEGDKHGTRNGWYVVHLDGVPAGAFGSWKVGETPAIPGLP